MSCCIWLTSYKAVGAVTFGMACWGLKRKVPIHGRLPLLDKMKKLDLLGAGLLISGLIALFFSLQWGGSRYEWSNPKVYSCLTVCGILLIAFVILEIRQKEV